eukprot:gene199-426_t
MTNSNFVGAKASQAHEDDDDFNFGHVEVEEELVEKNLLGLSYRELRDLKIKFLGKKKHKIQQQVFGESDFIDVVCECTQLFPYWDEEKQHLFRQELRTLFRKVDACKRDSAMIIVGTNDKVISWEDFTNYVLWHLPTAAGSMEGRSHFRDYPDRQEKGKGHRDMITALIFIGKEEIDNKYRRCITASRDGILKVWKEKDNKFYDNLVKSIAIGHNNWITCAAWMPESRRLAVASSDFLIHFYEETFTNCVAKIDHSHGTPLCLGYSKYAPVASSTRELLMVGDDKGHVTIYQLEKNWSSQLTSNKSRAQTVVTASSKRMETSGVKILTAKLHTDWITKVSFIPELQALVSSSLDETMAIVDVSTGNVRSRIHLHTRGVLSFCWCNAFKFMASCGLDRTVNIFNPYTGRAINYLQGHSSAVNDVCVNEQQSQLISISSSKEFKVWDIRNYKLLQTFQDTFEHVPENRFSSVAFDFETQSLFCASSNISIYPLNIFDHQSDNALSHYHPIVAADFSEEFSEVVSVDNRGHVIVWDVRSGKIDFDFQTLQNLERPRTGLLKGSASGKVRLTKAILKASISGAKRTLLVSRDDGVIDLWNFTNAQHLRAFELPTSALCELRDIIFFVQGQDTFVCGTGWDRRIFIWPDHREDKSFPKIILGEGLNDDKSVGHQDDVRCCALVSDGQGVGLLASGGDDGRCVIWKIQENYNNLTSSRNNSVKANIDGALAIKAQLSDDAKRFSESPKFSIKSSPERKESHFKKKDVRVSIAPIERTESLISEANKINDDHLEALRDDVTNAVLSMIYFESEQCLVTSHADGYVRFWCMREYLFLCRLWESEKEGALVSQQSALRKMKTGFVKPSLKETTSNLLPDSSLPNFEIFVFHKQRNFLVAAGGGIVKVFDLSNFSPRSSSRLQVPLVCKFKPHNSQILTLRSFDFDDNHLILTSSKDGRVVLHSLVLEEFEVEQKEDEEDITIDHDGKNGDIAVERKRLLSAKVKITGIQEGKIDPLEEEVQNVFKNARKVILVAKPIGSFAPDHRWVLREESTWHKTMKAPDCVDKSDGESDGGSEEEISNRFSLDSSSIKIDSSNIYNSKRKVVTRLRVKPKKGADQRVGNAIQNPPSEVYCHLSTEKYKPDLKLGDIKFTSPRKKERDESARDFWDF